MTTKKEVETILRLNGISVDASDEVIRSVLLKINPNQDSVEEAMTALRKTDTYMAKKKPESDGLQKLFFTDTKLKPSEISQYLGIEVEQTDVIISHSKSKQNEIPAQHLIVIWFAALVLAMVIILVYMYTERVGIFYS